MSGCGSEAGHQRHRRAGETPCPACKMAHNAYTSHLRGAERAPRQPNPYLPRLFADIGERPWLEHAACADHDVNLFYPDGVLGRPAGGDPDRLWAAGRLVCAGCPVRQECLDWALEHAEREGLWGGATPTERLQMRRRRAG